MKDETKDGGLRRVYQQALNASLESAKCGSLSMRERFRYNNSVQRGYQRGPTRFLTDECPSHICERNNGLPKTTLARYQPLETKPVGLAHCGSLRGIHALCYFLYLCSTDLIIYIRIRIYYMTDLITYSQKQLIILQIFLNDDQNCMNL